MKMNERTPGPWYVGAQNDKVYVTAGRPPAADNDYPVHDADRTVVATPSNAADAPVLAAAPQLEEALGCLLSVLEVAWSAEQLNIPEVREARAALAKARGENFARDPGRPVRPHRSGSARPLGYQELGPTTLAAHPDRCSHGIRYPHECKECIYGD